MTSPHQGPPPAEAAPSPHPSAAGRLALLRRATAVLSSSAGVDESLTALSRVVVPELADWCSVSVVDDDGRIRRVALTTSPAEDAGDADPRAEIAERMLGGAANDPAAGSGVAAVIRTGRSVLHADVDDGLLRATAPDDDYYALTVRMGIRSAVIAPLRARGRTIGALSLLSTRADRRFDEDDRAFAEELGRWAALTLDNDRLLREARQASRRFRDLVDNLDVVVWEAAATMPPRLTYVSNRIEALLGYPAERWTGNGADLLDVVHPEDRHEVVERWAEALSTRGRHTIEHRVVTADGRRSWVQQRLEVVAAEDGGSDRVLGLMVDITAERHSTARLTAQYAITNAVATATRLDDALPAVLEAVCTSLGWSVGTFWAATSAGVMRFVTSWNDPDVDAGDFLATAAELKVPWGAVLSGRVWADRRPVWIADVTADEQFHRAAAAARADLHGGLGFPVTAGGRVLGVMEFFSTRIREPDGPLLDMLTSAGAQVGQLLERLRVQDDAAFRAALLKAQSDTGAEAQLVLAPDGAMLSCNRRFIEMWSMPAQVVESGDGEACLEVMRGQVDRSEAFVERIRRLSSHPEEDAGDEVSLRDGRILERYGAPLVGDDGTYYGWAWYFRDVTRARRTEHELRESRGRFASLARTLQASLLPPRAPVVPGLDVAARYRAAGEGIDVGGDFYDVFGVGEDDWGIVIGDVSGKGPGAAALTALARYTIRASASRGVPPSRVLADLNDAILREDDGERFCTTVYMRLRVHADRTVAQFGVGGHPQPAVVRAGGSVELTGRIGTLIGALPNPSLFDDTVELESGDAVVLCTDGVLEARSGDELFGTSRLLESLAKGAGATAAELADQLVDAVIDFAGEPRDDVAIVVVRVPPVAAVRPAPTVPG